MIRHSLNEGPSSDNIAVVIFFMDEMHVLRVAPHSSLGLLREMWSSELGASPSVAFFSAANQYFTDDMTIAQILRDTGGRVLELRAVLRTSFWLQVFGFEESRTLFEVVPSLTPAAVRREIAQALGVFADDFRIMSEDCEFDQELPFNEQNISECELLTIDLRVKLKLRSEQDEELKTMECFASDCIADVKQRLGVTDEKVIVATQPYRRVLLEPLRLCHFVSDVNDLILPIDLVVEQKVLMAFEPIGLEHLRQNLLVAPSATPLDLYDEVSERFKLSNEFRLCIYGQALDPCKSLLDNIYFIDSDDIIQIDLVHRFVIIDLWNEKLTSCDDLVYLYSTESSSALFGRDILENQRLFYDDIQLTIFGSVLDIFGSIGGQCRSLIPVDRDVQRDLHFLSFNEIQKRLGWSRDRFSEVVPTQLSRNPKEIMHYGDKLVPQASQLRNLLSAEEALYTIDPLRVIVKEDKKLRIHRFAHGSRVGDVRARMQQCPAVSSKIQQDPASCLDAYVRHIHHSMDDEAIDRRIDRELFRLEYACRFQTRMTVTVNNQWYGCWFEEPQVSFTDVMISVGKKAEVMPRLLFSKKLYCCGCGRKVSKKEEPHQAIPAGCCSVRSLQLTDRPVRDVGIQTAGTRRRDVETYTLGPEMRDVCVGPESQYRKAVIQVSNPSEISSVALIPQYRQAILSSTSPGGGVASVSTTNRVRISALTPSGGFDEATVPVTAGSECEALLELERISNPERAVFYAQEIYYMRRNIRRRAVQCYDESTRNLLLIDFEDGILPRNSSWLLFARRFFTHNAPLPVAPRLMPRVFILTDTEVVTLNRHGEFEVAPQSALIDPAFVTSMTGIRSGPQYFWELVGDSFVNASSGDVYWRRGWVPKGDDKRHVLALLRDGDRVPKAAVPKNKVLRVFRRSGVQLRIENGVVRFLGSMPTDKQIWDSPIKIESFDKEFTSAASKR